MEPNITVPRDSQNVFYTAGVLFHTCTFYYYWRTLFIKPGSFVYIMVIGLSGVQFGLQFGRPRSRSPICLITSMITDQIGWHEVLLPINHIYNEIWESIRRNVLEKELTTVSIARHVKRTYLSVTDSLEHALWCALSNYLGMTPVLTVLLMLKSWLVIANQIQGLCYSND